ncbi:MAG: integrase core domain-containing protein, partial [Akkermansiaceae bacterium]
ARELFYTLSEARVVIAAWKKKYNELRPHRSLGMKTPEEFANGWNPGDINTRFKLLNDLFEVEFTTDFNGGKWTGAPGAISAVNRGLPQLKLLPFFEVDESERTLTVHRILEIRQVLAAGAWRDYSLLEFSDMFLAYQDDLILFSSNPELELRKDFPILLGNVPPPLCRRFPKAPMWQEMNSKMLFMSITLPLRHPQSSAIPKTPRSQFLRDKPHP